MNRFLGTVVKAMAARPPGGTNKARSGVDSRRALSRRAAGATIAFPNSEPSGKRVRYEKVFRGSALSPRHEILRDEARRRIFMLEHEKSKKVKWEPQDVGADQFVDLNGIDAIY